MSYSEPNHHYAMDVVLQRVQALESRVGQLESQVVRLQGAPLTPTAPSLTFSTLLNNPPGYIPILPNQNATATMQQTSELPRQAIRAAEFNTRRTEAELAGMEALKRSTIEQHTGHGGPAKKPKQQTVSDWTKVNYARRSAPAAASASAPAPAPAPASTRSRIVSILPHSSTLPLPEHRRNPLVGGVSSTGNLILAMDVVIKCFRTEGHAQAGQLQTSSPKDWQLRVRFQLDPTGAPSISLVGRISKRGPLHGFVDQTGHKTPFATFRLNFDLKDVSEASLELDGVADPLLLPPDVAKQLEDPNEVPSSLRYLAFSWRKCQLVGFDHLHEVPVVSKDGTALLKALEVLGSRPSNAVQIWFLCTDQLKSSTATVDCILRAVSRARDCMYKPIGTTEKTPESALLVMAESCGN